MESSPSQFFQQMLFLERDARHRCLKWMNFSEIHCWGFFLSLFSLLKSCLVFGIHVHSWVASQHMVRIKVWCEGDGEKVMLNHSWWTRCHWELILHAWLTPCTTSPGVQLTARKSLDWFPLLTVRGYCTFMNTCNTILKFQLYFLISITFPDEHQSWDNCVTHSKC